MPAEAPAEAGGQAGGGRRRVAIDLAAGTAGGVCQLLVGHPFDTLKTKLQSQGAAAAAARFSGPGEALVRTVRDEGARGLYRGMGAPLATVALFNAVLFASRGAATAAALGHERRAGGGGKGGAGDGSGGDGAGDSPPPALSTRGQLFVALAASAAVSLVATPTELLKCRLQAQGDPRLAARRLSAGGASDATGKNVAVPLFRGPLDAARHVLARERGPVGLYKGLFATFARESLGNIAMFGAYDHTRRRLAARRGLSDPADLPAGDVLLAGGVGGIGFWLAAFPADLIKSKLQTQPFDRPLYRGFWGCGRTTVAQGGWRALWTGFTPALLRAAPANAVCFAGYEAARGRLAAAFG